ncbi:MAG: ISAzo13 family transposase [Methanosarcinaceae archaeon]|nr:ISAzo13 family transposase [Methanosarcinaceae archaeon]
MDVNKQYIWWLKALSGADEVQARRFAGAIALEIGWGGITKVEKLTGMSHSTIRKGIDELKTSEKLQPPERLRAPGGGRKRVEEKDPRIINDLEKIMEENTAGDPMSLLKWTNKSTYKIADELRRLKHTIDPDTVGRILKENDYSLQANKKNIEGSSVPERDAQFRHINEQAKEFTNQGYPVISVDAKKKENIGEFKNPGKTWAKKGQAKNVNVYDFPSLGCGRATPYGIYDVNRNEGMVNVGMSYDTSEFAVESIRQWWLLFGRKNYPNAKGLMICADGGGSNGSRNKGWKFHLQELVNQIGIPITVCHYPPGTSKWNKIEHCMFSFITMNWKGKPLVNFETVVKLIGATKTKKGLTVSSRLDQNEYNKGVKISDEDMAKLKMELHFLHPKWNYSILVKED